MSKEGKKLSEKVYVQQGCVPDYRVGFFNEANRSVNLTVCAGKDYFSPSVVSSVSGATWLRPVLNKFFFGRRAVWQRGSVMPSYRAQILVVELNPRILSLWPILISRKLCGKPTIVWGHYFGGRSTGRPSFRGLRVLMARMADGIAAYTEIDAERFRAWNHNKAVKALGNACLSGSDIKRDGDYNSSRCILYVGRLVSEKKVDVLLKGYISALECGADIGCLDIVGDRNAPTL